MTSENTKHEALFAKKLSQRLKKAIYDYGLIADGDKILIGLSGGKDSLALTELLAQQQRIHVPNFTLVAAHIELTNMPYSANYDYLQQFCEANQVEFRHIRTAFEPSNDAKKDSKTPCFFCSWSRRKALFEAAKELGCNKIALGHHQDDIIETFLLNLTYQSSLSTMPPLLKMDKFDMSIIRPLCLIREEEIIRLQNMRQYRTQVKSCTYENVTKRAEIKSLLAQMEQSNPFVRNNIWGAMHSIQSNYLPHKL